MIQTPVVNSKAEAPQPTRSKLAVISLEPDEESEEDDGKFDCLPFCALVESLCRTTSPRAVADAAWA